MARKRVKKKLPVTITQTVDINLDDVAEALMTSGFDNVIAFIKKLDLMCEDWGVTEELTEYFQSEMKKLDAFNAELDKAEATQPDEVCAHVLKS